jgi:tetratricopeptide (TPR) repeat protein
MKKITASFQVQRLLKEAKALYQRQLFNEARSIYEVLVKKIPSNPEVNAHLGMIELQSGNLKYGIAFLEKALTSNPNEFYLLLNLGSALVNAGEFSKGMSNLDLAIKINPHLSSLHYNKAIALKGMNQYPAAIKSYQEAIKIDPLNVQAIFNLAFLYNEIKEFDLALNLYSQGIEIDPVNANLFYNRGIVYENKNKFEEALGDFDKALAINPHFELCLFNKSGVLMQLGLIDKSLTTINTAITLSPNNLKNYIKKAVILEEQRDIKGAFELYDHVLKIQPENIEVKAKKSFSTLALENFQEGWELYENRWWNMIRIKSNKPELESFNIKNKSILIWGEQGVGDQIIYASLLMDAFKTPNNFYVSIDKRLEGLFRRSFFLSKNVQFISLDETVPESIYDYHIPMASLGKFFRNHIEDFDRKPEAYLKADPERISFLSKRIKTNKNKICGISWRSKNPQLGLSKSLALQQMLPILKLDNITFVNLQYGETENEIKTLDKKFNIKIKTVDEVDNFNDLDGLTALVEACDFIVTSSNVTAHIAGALNKKTYLLLPFAFGRIWYWGESRTQSLWYPSISIYRSNSSGTWDNPIDALSKNLKIAYG